MLGELGGSEPLESGGCCQLRGTSVQLTVYAKRGVGIRAEGAVEEHVEAGHSEALAPSSLPDLLAVHGLRVRPVVARTSVEENGDDVEVDKGARTLDGSRREAGVDKEVGDAVDRASGEVVAAAVGWCERGVLWVGRWTGRSGARKGCRQGEEGSMKG